MTANASTQLCDPDALVASMKAGDLEALDRMTRCFGERLMAVGRRQCRTETEAEDAVQDALLSAGEHLTDFRGDGSPEGWLVRMVTNACRRMQRGRKNDPYLHQDVDDTPVAAGLDRPDALAGRGELAEALGEALLELSPEERTVLLLAEGEDWTAPEIARHMGSTPGAIRTRLTRIRQKLRPRLEDIAFDLL